MTRLPSNIAPFFTRREWIHLLLLIGCLVFVVRTMGRLKEPDSMAWLFGEQTQVPAEWVADPVAGQLAVAQADGNNAANAQAAVEPNQADEPAQEPNQPPVDAQENQDAPAAEPDLNLDAEDEAPSRAAAFNPLNLVSLNELDEVNPVYLEDVEDELNPSRPPKSKITNEQIRSLRVKANPAVYQILGVASTTPPAELAAKSRKDVFPTNLLKDPDSYRGQIVHIEGVMRRLDLVAEGLDEKNPYGIDRIYEGWIFVEDLPEAVRVWFTSLPENLEPSLTMKENVSFDGYFLKLYLYKGQDEVWRVSPMLLGFQPKVVDLNLARWDLQAMWFSIFIGVAFFIGVVVLWFMSRTYSRQTKEYRATTASRTGAPVDFLDVTAGEPGDEENPFTGETDEK